MPIELTDEDLEAIESATGLTPNIDLQDAYLAGLAAGIERAAKVCERLILSDAKTSSAIDRAYDECADAIRALLQPLP